MSELPAIKYLDRSTFGAGYSGWVAVEDLNAENPLRLSIIAHARTLEALAKYEPEPVDEDRLAVGRIIAAYYGNSAVTAHKGAWDAATAQYKAERPTITDDEALLIAREICALVARGIFRAKNYRDGTYDGSPELQFALAMVKRDPAALEAFRGVGK